MVLGVSGVSLIFTSLLSETSIVLSSITSIKLIILAFCILALLICSLVSDGAPEHAIFMKLLEVVEHSLIIRADVSSSVSTSLPHLSGYHLQKLFFNIM